MVDQPGLFRDVATFANQGDVGAALLLAAPSRRTALT